MSQRKLLLSSFSSFLLVLGVIIFFGYHVHQAWRLPTGNSQPATLIIAKGTSADKIMTQLAAHKIISSRWSFKIHLYFRRLSLKAGEYAFESSRTLKSVMEKLAQGQTVIHKFTVIEGQTSRSILDQLAQIPILQGSINISVNEGALYPETYFFSYGDHPQDLIDRMVKTQQHTLAQEWIKRDPDIPLKTPQEALILASIVEKESAKRSEQSHIAGLFYNRLAINMPLQSDPTVLYGYYITDQKPLNRELSRAELKGDHLYNTYLHPGLPPGPICNPGLSALQAVLHPSKTLDFYFVADGTGGHVFSKNYEEHRRHHQALRLRRRQDQGLP